MNESKPLFVNNIDSCELRDRDRILLHVHDLPQLYQKPSADVLLRTLGVLSQQPVDFSRPGTNTGPQVSEAGVPRYLTSIISSSLTWIDDDNVKDEIWSAASARLSERAGRNAMPAITRKFVVNDHLTFTIFEPSLTGDNLGFKTWSSSLLLSRRLEHLRKYIVGDCSQVLELGAGTGLVGMAAACIWNTHVLLTDLPEIVPNLQKNLEQNKGLLKKKASVDARSLDWRDENDVPNHDGEKYMVIVAADPIYSPEQPSILVSTVCRWLHPSSAARFVVGVPLRDRFDQERQSLKRYLQVHNFQTVAEGVDTGYDDWRDRDGQPMEVKCWWTVWQRYPPD